MRPDRDHGGVIHTAIPDLVLRPAATEGPRGDRTLSIRAHHNDVILRPTTADRRRVGLEHELSLRAHQDDVILRPATTKPSHEQLSAGRRIYRRSTAKRLRPATTDRRRVGLERTRSLRPHQNDVILRPATTKPSHEKSSAGRRIYRQTTSNRLGGAPWGVAFGGEPGMTTHRAHPAVDRGSGYRSFGLRAPAQRRFSRGRPQDDVFRRLARTESERGRRHDDVAVGFAPMLSERGRPQDDVFGGFGAPVDNRDASAVSARYAAAA
jgi:hypothetical protein